MLYVYKKMAAILAPALIGTATGFAYVTSQWSSKR